MSNVQVFNFQSQKIRSMLIDEEPWFVAKDICAILDIRNSRDAINSLDYDEKGVVTTDTPGGRQNMTGVNESGLYTLIFKSRKPEARKFRKWVTSEVLPRIRKTGGFQNGQHPRIPQTYAEALQAAAEQAQKVEEQQRQLEAQKPKVMFADAIETSKTSILIGELSKLLRQNGIKIGQNRLFEWMRTNGYLISRKGSDYNMPTQRAMELELFEIKETAITNDDGHIRIRKTTKVRGKGQRYFLNKFLKQHPKYKGSTIRLR